MPRVVKPKSNAFLWNDLKNLCFVSYNHSSDVIAD